MTAPQPVQGEADGFTSYGEFRWACDADERMRATWTPLWTAKPPAPTVGGADWQGTPEQINALPEKLRHWIMWLQTDADPAGTIQQNWRLEQENAALRALISAPPAVGDGQLREAVAYAANFFRFETEPEDEWLAVEFERLLASMNAPAVQIAAPDYRGMTSDELVAASTRAVAAGFDGCDDGMVVDTPAVQIATPTEWNPTGLFKEGGGSMMHEVGGRMVQDCYENGVLVSRVPIVAAPGDVERAIAHALRFCDEKDRLRERLNDPPLPISGAIRTIIAAMRSQGQADAVELLAADVEYDAAREACAEAAGKGGNPVSLFGWHESVPAAIQRMQDATTRRANAIAAALAQQANKDPGDAAR